MTIPTTIPALLLPMVAAIALRAQAPAARTQEPAPIPAAGATEPSPAEQQFRDAWWAESGRNDTDAALRGYLAAAVADGPAAIRARALLFAGRVQQRLGDDGAALATFRRLVTQFGEQRETVEAARVHLRELTSEDLRRNYDEWFERRLFSEEVQLVILGKIEALGRLAGERPQKSKEQTENRQQWRALEDEILAFGKGAVPALRKYAVGSHEGIARQAVALLFRLGEVPPIEALIEQEEWASDHRHWIALLRADTRPALPPMHDAGAWHRPWLRAALQGPEALARRLLESSTATAPELLGILAGALLVDGRTKGSLLAVAMQEETPLAVREAIEERIREEVVDLDPAQWFAIGEDPLSYDLRHMAVHNAARRLRRDDGQLLDGLLARVRAQQGDLLDACSYGLVEGLDGHPAIDQLPWSTGRLTSFLQVALERQISPGNVLFVLRRKDGTRALLAEALLADPTPIAAASRTRVSDDDEALQHLRECFSADPGDGSEQLLRLRWNRAVVAALSAAWPRYTDPQRLDALFLLRGIAPYDSDPAVLVPWVQGQLASASAAVEPALRAYLADR